MPPQNSYWFVLHPQGLQQLGTALWQNHKPDPCIDQMQVGERIALHTLCSKNNTLPFEIAEQAVSVMAIHAIGEIVENLQDQQSLRIQWQQIFPSPKEWYFYTCCGQVIWQVQPHHWMSQALVDFTFNAQPQDYQRFLQAPYWQHQLTLAQQPPFQWIEFYQAFAHHLRAFRFQRHTLVQKVLQIAAKYQLNYILGKQLSDICPFTVMGLFNRGISTAKRIQIAEELAEFIGVDVAVPTCFDGIPILNNQRSWFFGFVQHQATDDIEQLWQLFELAQQKLDQDTRQQFIEQYDRVSAQHGVGWNITMGLFWIRPQQFMSLDSQSQRYIQQDLGLKIGSAGAKRRCSGQEYWHLLIELQQLLMNEQSLAYSFPALSLLAWEQQGAIKSLVNDNDDDLEEVVVQLQEPVFNPYGVAQIEQDGCFLATEQLELALSRLKEKKNLILQGSTGTGKTWLAQRLAQALIGHQHSQQRCHVQFHANTTYEDFIRGWRPQYDPQTQRSELSLVDGIFLQCLQKAQAEPNENFVLIIEEINRGQVAHIFGELLTLLEHTKRGPTYALSLMYPREQETIFIPDNFYLIATMNLTDRSLVRFDLALRRRFAFITLGAEFNEKWLQWLIQHHISEAFARHIQHNIQALNQLIADDPQLGGYYVIGHSFFTPHQRIDDEKAWYLAIIDTEIAPLLEEYWFDRPEELQAQLQLLRRV